MLRGLAGAASAGGIGTLYWTWPRYNATSTNPHDPITKEQCSLLRMVPSGDSVDPSCNPGARTWGNFMTPAELQELLKELQPVKQQVFNVCKCQNVLLLRCVMRNVGEEFGRSTVWQGCRSTLWCGMCGPQHPTTQYVRFGASIHPKTDASTC